MSPIVVFVYLSVTELSFLVHVGLLSDAVIFLVFFAFFIPRDRTWFSWLSSRT